MKVPRIAFEIVLLEDTKLWSAQNISEYVWDKYNLLLDACGWSREEYEAKVLTLIDNEWIRLCNSN